MNEEAQAPQQTNEQTNKQAIRNLPVTVHAQYIRDLSFENPNAPEALKMAGGRPNLDLNIDIGLREIPDSALPGLYEVALRLRASAKREDTVIFIAEIDYAASVTVGPDVPQEAAHPLLMIEIPRLLFPFARQILSDLSQQGGYPAVLMAPVDFQALYLQKFSAALAGEQGDAQKKTA